MKTIFLGDAARDSGSLGFSEAWPLSYCELKHSTSPHRNCSPSCPHCVNVHTLGNVHDEFDIGVVVVVGTSRDLFKISSAGFLRAGPLRFSSSSFSALSSLLATYLNVLISHSNIVCVCAEVLWRSHHSELDSPLVAEGFVCPFSDRPYLFHSCNSVIGDENLGRSGLV